MIRRGNADNAVVLKCHFQRLHKGEKGKARGGLNNSLTRLWTFQVGRRNRYSYGEMKHPKGSEKVFS